MVMLITQDELADALIDAYERGVDVDIVIDDDWYFRPGSDYQDIVDAGIDIRGDERGGLMHHKVMIIDGYIIVTGSYNWSASAEDSNDENILIIKSTIIASEYIDEFKRIWSQTTS
jgi:phosphatidylserine/phosphatidylglycerophosphate/cardiolipin synthase-like enzyme